MPEETPAAPKASRLRRKSIPYVPPAIETLTAIIVPSPLSADGVTLYHGPIGDAENEAGARLVTFYNPDRSRFMKRSVNLPDGMDADERATVIAGQARSFLSKLLAGVVPLPVAETAEEPDEEEAEDAPETPAA